MSTPQVLFISGAIGLGHVTRDLAIAAALRTRCPDLRLIWLAADSARQALREAGEELAGPFSLPLTNPAALFKSPRVLRGLLRLIRNQKRNGALLKKLTDRQRFDLIIADEAYDLMLAVAFNPALKPAPLAMIFDFVGMDVTSRKPLEWFWVQIMSWWGVRLIKRFPRVFDLTLMVGEEEDVADKPFGLFMANRRDVARAIVKFVGYICPFNPADYRDRLRLRSRLGYGPEPLVICSIGGTAIGKPLLELCGRAYPYLEKQSPDLRMVLVCGPRLRPETLSVPEGIERKGYVHHLFEHLAACDLAIVQGGGTTTLELTALRRPFIYFPLEQHFEQRSHVAARIERHRAGVRLEFSQTTPEALAAAVLAYMGAEVHYPPIATDGAQRAAEHLGRLMEDR
jgi:UDP-N-acetylglucosamine:LPS N-acetylglucosamine transferase